MTEHTGSSRSHTRSRPLPRQPIDRLIDPFARFLHIEASGGVVLLVCTVVALVLANSSWAEAYQNFWHLHLRIGAGDWTLDKPLELWINDGLMTIFFFVVGLEIKRELVGGELRDKRQALLPIIAALGGMVVPALVYWLLQRGTPGARGWGVPMATDIAFVVGVLTVFGNRVPRGLKILLLSLAIVDDIGAILVIALFYSTNVSVPMLLTGAAGLAIVALMRRVGVRSVAAYVVVGAGIWLAFLKSGVHPTIAGVVLGLMTPSSALLAQDALRNFLRSAQQRLMGANESEHGSLADEHRELVRHLMEVSRESVPPLTRLEESLHTWVGFAIMPIFALANAGVPFKASSVAEPIGVAVALGLVLGKPLGIFLFSAAAIRIGVARLPTGVSWWMLWGGGCLGGIGFTMSLFIAGLAFEGPALETAKVGTLTGSLLSALLGAGVLLACTRRK